MRRLQAAGYPLRLRTSTKLGYKSPTWITSIEVTDTYVPEYWEKLGLGWFAGITRGKAACLKNAKGLASAVAGS